MTDLWWELENLRQLKGACSCGDSTILGVIHTDTKPCYLPTIYRPLTDEQIWRISRTSGSQVDFARAIEKAHGIGGINEV
jgi:hypothetical protein